jgi:hypothetical protein
MRREHAVLHTVQVTAVDGRHKTASKEAEYHARRKIVLPKTMTELEVLVKHSPEREWNRLEMDERYSGVRMKTLVLLLA